MKIEKIVAKVSDLQDGEMREVNVGERSALLVRVDGKFHAIGAKCSHFGGPLAEGALSGHRVRCPWHQACFDVVTGNVEEPPALDSLPHFDVRIEGENVIVSIPEDAEDQRIPPMKKHNAKADSRTFAIVGAGAAGNIAAETLRQDGFEGRLVMVTREKHLPYDRTQLSKGYMKKKEADRPILRSENFYKDYDIEVLTKHEVTRIDSKDKTIMFSDCSLLKYDRLLLATGSTPRRLGIPGGALQNVLTLRSLDNADKIKSMAKKDARLVIIGASFIGMEAAASLIGHGLSITVVAPESVPFQNTLGEKIGSMLKGVHEENGVSFRLGAKLARFEGGSKVEKVVLESGDTLEADFVLMGIGVKPATEFPIGDLKLNSDGSIPVDEHFCAAEDIYAAGDIASFIDWRTKERIRIEHWRLAEQHGRVAGHNMAGKETEYRGIPFFWTSQPGVTVDYMGYVGKWDEIIFHGEPAAKEFVAFYVKRGKVMAVAGAGDDVKLPAIAELMRVDEMPAPDELRKGSVDFAESLRKR